MSHLSVLTRETGTELAVIGRVDLAVIEPAELSPAERAAREAEYREVLAIAQDYRAPYGYDFAELVSMSLAEITAAVEDRKRNPHPDQIRAHLASLVQEDKRLRRRGHPGFKFPDPEWDERTMEVWAAIEAERYPVLAAIEAGQPDVLAAILAEDRAAIEAAPEDPERAAREAERRREAEELRRMQRMGLADVPDNGTLESHLMWLVREFGGREFNTTQVRNAALEDPEYRRPPGRTRPTDPDFTNQLGRAWAKHAGQVAGGMWLERSHSRSMGAWRWRVVVKESPSHDTHPGSPART